MDPFLKKFFPGVYRKKNLDKSSNEYCQYDSQTLTMFTSSLYLAALLSSLVASTVTRRFGRKRSMLFGGLLFLVGALINGFAQHVWMLIVGRILLGFGIGFANQVNTAFPFLFFKRLFWFYWKQYNTKYGYVSDILSFCSLKQNLCCLKFRLFEVDSFFAVLFFFFVNNNRIMNAYFVL